jgi:hypothetical protein
MVNLQDIMASVYRLLQSGLPGLACYNGLATYGKASPYAVFTVTETQSREYFGTNASDHDLAITVTIYQSRDRGAGILRRMGHQLITAWHKAAPTITGMTGTCLTLLSRGNPAPAGSNLYALTMAFRLVGTGA